MKLREETKLTSYQQTSFHSAAESVNSTSSLRKRVGINLDISIQLRSGLRLAVVPNNGPNPQHPTCEKKSEKREASAPKRRVNDKGEQ